MNSYLIFLTLVASSSSVLMISVIDANSGSLVNFQEDNLDCGLLTNKVEGEVLVFSVVLVLSFRVVVDFLFVGLKIFLSSTFLNSMGSYPSLFSAYLSNFDFKN
jgi:hypothetical protein